MVNQEQLKILTKQGVKAWKNWREDNPELKIALSSADLSSVNLISADLSNAQLISANLSGANLYRADLSGTDLSGTDLSGANLGEANLYHASLFSAKLISADLSGAKLIGANLRGANLYRASLSSAFLSGADLSGAKLIGTNLTSANLQRIQALRTNFNGATLTGACIEDWNINRQTQLNSVICDYIYLKKKWNQDQEKYELIERRPCERNRNFESGELSKLVQKSLETLDLIFKDGIDWRVVAYSLKNTQGLNEDTPLAIQTIENKGDGVVLIKVNVPQNAAQDKIEADFWQSYELANKTLKEQYQARVLDQDQFTEQQVNK